MNIFECSDYKEILGSMLADPAAPRGYQGKLAMIAKCQKSFMSQVVKGDAQLNLDQAARLTKHWRFNDEETDYFLTLVELARAGSQELKKILQRRIADMQTKQFQPVQTYHDAFEIPASKQADFYSKWYVSAVYMMVGIGLTEKDMAERLRIRISDVQKALATLKKIDLIVERKGKLQKTEGNLWLSDSPFIANFRNAWRSYGQLRMPLAGDDELFYSSLFTVDEDTMLAFYRELSKAVTALKQRSDETIRETNLCCVNIDFFQV